MTNPSQIIRWAGSKRKILLELEKGVPPKFHTYFEPFFGSGALYYRLKPSNAVLGDLNEHLITFYNCARSHPIQVWTSAIHYPRTQDHYYKIRQNYNVETNPIRRASMFLYLNRFCFNAIFRTNQNGEFNVPFGTKTGSFPSKKEFETSSAMLRSSTLICGDFEESLKTAKRGDFVYLDPPYAYSTQRNRGEYGNGSFWVKDLARLKILLIDLDKRGVSFLLSYLECTDFKGIANLFSARRIPVKRCIAGHSSARKTVNEVLVSNY